MGTKVIVQKAFGERLSQKIPKIIQKLNDGNYKTIIKPLQNHCKTIAKPLQDPYAVSGRLVVGYVH